MLELSDGKKKHVSDGWYDEYGKFVEGKWDCLYVVDKRR